MTINTYLSMITLNVNGIRAPIKRHRETEWIKKQTNKKKTHLYAAYKRLIADLKTPADWKWGDGKTLSCKWMSKEGQSNNTYIGQNRLTQKL